MFRHGTHCVEEMRILVVPRINIFFELCRFLSIIFAYVEKKLYFCMRNDITHDKLILDYSYENTICMSREYMSERDGRDGDETPHPVPLL